jgi:hypothetical protein
VNQPQSFPAASSPPKDTQKSSNACHVAVKTKSLLVSSSLDIGNFRKSLNVPERDARRPYLACIRAYTFFLSSSAERKVCVSVTSC